MFGPKMHVHEAPLALMGMAVGGLTGAGIIGGAGILGGGLIGGLAGAALGGVGATLLGQLMKGPKMPKVQDQSSNAAAQTPALPPATAMPATPMTPASTPGLGTAPDGSQDVNSSLRPQDAAEASPATNDEIARGQLEKKRRGRLSTILTSPQSRLEDGQDEGFERLGG